jgi:hypothetical protein
LENYDDDDDVIERACGSIRENTNASARKIQGDCVETT